MNSDIANAKPAVLAALRKANNIVGIGDVYGWPRPQAYSDALAMLNAAREAERDVPTIPPPPQKPAGIRKWIDATVEVRHQDAARRDIVDELVLNLERATAQAGLSAIPDTVSRLVVLFDELVSTFDSLADAPRTLTGHESTEAIEEHTAALRIASELSNALLQRAQIADAANEGADVYPDVVWLVLAPHGETTRDGINDALAAFRSRVPQALTEWDELRPLGLRLAQIGEVAARRERHTTFMWRASQGPDGGLRDHAYSEFEDDQPVPGYGALLQAETDAMFANSPSISI